jgi:hypothetical protein
MLPLMFFWALSKILFENTLPISGKNSKKVALPEYFNQVPIDMTTSILNLLFLGRSMGRLQNYSFFRNLTAST